MIDDAVPRAAPEPGQARAVAAALGRRRLLRGTGRHSLRPLRARRLCARGVGPGCRVRPRRQVARARAKRSGSSSAAGTPGFWPRPVSSPAWSGSSPRASAAARWSGSRREPAMAVPGPQLAAGGSAEGILGQGEPPYPDAWTLTRSGRNRRASATPAAEGLVGRGKPTP
jgi:hypothetical protein